MPTRRPTALPQHAAHRVPQQIHVRRVMHVGLDHERITPTAQRPARLFSRDRMAAFHHQSAHRRQQLRRQQAHVVDHRLVLVVALLPEIAVPQKRTQRPVMVGQIVKPVEVAAETLFHHPQHQNPPQLHARTTDRPIRTRQHVLVQQLEQPGPQRLVAVDVLKTAKQRRRVVARLRVDPDLADRRLAQPELPTLNLPHRLDLRRSSRIRPKRPIQDWILRHRRHLQPTESLAKPRRINDSRVFWRALA